MSRWILLLSLLALPASAATYYLDALALTSTPPVVDAPPTPCYLGTKCPLNFYGAATVLVTVCAVEGETITGGKIRLWRWVDGIALWSTNREGDLPVLPGTDSRCVSWARELGPGVGFLLPQTEGVTVSGGIEVAVHMRVGTR